MSIYTDRHGTQRWTCFATGAHGTAIDLVTTIRACTVRDAIDWLANHTNLTDHDAVVREAASAVRPVGDPDAVLHTYIDACQRWLWSPAGVGPRRWLQHGRHLPVDLARVNHLGFDPGRRHLDRPDGLPHGPGIVIPTLTETGEAIYLQVRNLRPDARVKYTNPAGHIAANPKLHWPHPAQAVSGDTLYVCEGAIDALTITNLGRRAVAILSAAYTTPTVAAALARRPEHLALALDNDPAGRAATAALLQHFRTARRTSRVTVIELPAGNDLNALADQPEHLAGILDRADSRAPPFGRSGPSR